MDAWKQYVDDPRTICKYGAKCYQKNPQHFSTFKHPPRSKRRLLGNHHGQKRAKFQPLSNKPDRVEIPESDDSELEDDEISTELKNSPKSEHSLENIPSVSTVNAPVSTTNVALDSQVSSSVAKEITYLDMHDDHSKMIKELFLVDMPEDFYSFWKFLSRQNDSGIDVLKTANLEVIGPFDVLRGKLPSVADKDKYLVHWRFFYDPPEFQAVIKGKGKSEFHIGYYRDAPNEKPVFVGSNDSSKNCSITPLADNIFGAVFVHLQAEKKKSPFTAMTYQKILDNLKASAGELKLTLDKYDTRRRLASIAVTRTFHGAGIVVPYNKSTQLGYRPLVESDASIKKMLMDLSSAKSDLDRDKALSSLQPVITYTNIAMDECDFGTGLELGIDLFCSGLPELDATLLAALTTAYSLLKRNEFIKIIEAHLKCRRKGADLSVLNLS